LALWSPDHIEGTTELCISKLNLVSLPSSKCLISVANTTWCSSTLASYCAPILPVSGGPLEGYSVLPEALSVFGHLFDFSAELVFAFFCEVIFG